MRRGKEKRRKRLKETDMSRSFYRRSTAKGDSSSPHRYDDTSPNDLTFCPVSPAGIAYPTTLSINSVIQNLCPLPSDANAATNVLVDNDVVKIVMGAHIDGYAVITAETIVVSSSPITEIRGALLTAAHQAAEVAIRLVKPGVKNWEITEGIRKVLKEYEAAGVKGVESILSQQVSYHFSSSPFFHVASCFCAHTVLEPCELISHTLAKN